jgi:hypothetical protein
VAGVAARGAPPLESSQPPTDDAAAAPAAEATAEAAAADVARPLAAAADDAGSLRRTDSRGRSGSRRGGDVTVGAAEAANEILLTAPLSRAHSVAEDASVAAAAVAAAPPPVPQMFARRSFVLLGPGGGGDARRAELARQIEARGGAILRPQDAADAAAANARGSSGAAPTPLSRSGVARVMVVCSSGPGARAAADALLQSPVAAAGASADSGARGGGGHGGSDGQGGGSGGGGDVHAPICVATYLWLGACLRDGALYAIAAYPWLFAPQPWPLRADALTQFSSGPGHPAAAAASPPSSSSPAASRPAGCLVALSQFVGAERAALVRPRPPPTLLGSSCSTAAPFLFSFSFLCPLAFVLSLLASVLALDLYFSL